MSAKAELSLQKRRFCTPPLTGITYDLTTTENVTKPPELIITPVEDPEMLRKWIRTAVVSFGIPDAPEKTCFDLFNGLGFDWPLRHYLGVLNGKPVATAHIFLGAGVAGIYWVATHPEARRQGIGSAMTFFALREVRNMGYRISILHSSAMGLSIYQRLGFQEYRKMSCLHYETLIKQGGR